MLTALLPSSSAPISRSRASSRRLTMAARRLPCFSSRSMRAREDAVSAVSLPAKKNDSSRQSEDDDDRKPVECGHRAASFSVRNARTSAASTSRSDEGLPDAARQDEGELAALDLLVLRHQLHQRVRRRAQPPARRSSRVGSPTAARWCATRAGVGRSAAARAGPRTRTRSAMPSATASPCSSRSEKPAAASKRMAEGVAEIEQRALAGLALVARRRSPALARQLDRDRVLARRAAGEDVAPVRLEPGEESRRRRAARIWRPRHSRRGTRAAAACRAARCRRPPGSADGRRRPDSCRAGELIAGLAADRGIDLRQQRGRHLHDIEAAPHDRAAKPARSPTTPPPSATTSRRARCARRSALADLLERRGSSSSPRPAARRCGATRCRPRRALLRPREMMRGDRLVGDDRGAQRRAAAPRCACRATRAARGR